MRVDGDEAAGVAGQPGKPGAGQRGHADHRVGAQRWPWLDVEESVAQSQRPGTRPQRDAARVEHLPHRDAGRRAEEAERFGLRRDDAERRVGDSAVAQVDGGHHRQLVDRQRPRRLGGNREDETTELASLDSVEDRGDVGGLGGPGERQRAGHGGRRHGADRDDKDVVGRRPRRLCTAA